MDVILRHHFWLANLVAIALCAGLGGSAAAHLVEQRWLGSAEPGRRAAAARSSLVPPSAAKVHGKHDEIIISRNLLCSGCQPVTHEEAAGRVRSSEVVRSSLPLELVATMWVERDPRWSMAVIRDTGSKDKDAQMYNVGKIVDGTHVTVARVDPHKVWLKNDGRYEFLELEGAGGDQKPAAVRRVDVPAPDGTGLEGDVQRGVRCGGAQCDVDRTLLDKLLSNTTELAAGARVMPWIRDGRPSGFKLLGIRPGSIYAKIGLHDGDAVKQINGMEMASPDQALTVYSKLRTASHLTVSLDRRGETITLDYTIR